MVRVGIEPTVILDIQFYIRQNSYVISDKTVYLTKAGSAGFEPAIIGFGDQLATLALLPINFDGCFVAIVC